MGKKAVGVVVVLLLLLSAFFLWHSQQQEAVYTIDRHIRYGFTVRNTTNRLAKDVQLWVYAPVSQTPTQKCALVETTPPHELIADDLGNQILRFSFDKIPPYASRDVRIKADLMLAETPNRLPRTVDPSRFLQPEPYVESDHPDIIARAKQLAAADDLKTAKAIFQWVIGHISYSGYLKNERGALYALTQKKGDCTEYMDLFAALCRAAGIPCRRMGGYICTKNMVLGAAGYHNWAEFYVSGKWRLADPQNKVFMEKEADYVATRIISDSYKNDMQGYDRFRVSGDGITARMN